MRLDFETFALNLVKKDYDDDYDDIYDDNGYGNDYFANVAQTFAS